MNSPKQISPAALLLAIKVNLLRNPLFHPETVMDIFGLTRDQVRQKIQDGTFPWAFDLARGGSRRTEPRILSLSIIEQQIGSLPGIGRSRDLVLPEVIDLILPKRDVRSTELRKLLSMNSEQMQVLRADLVVTQPPRATDGAYSYTVYSRASVAEMLAKRRMT